MLLTQPPSGGCVLKPGIKFFLEAKHSEQPPSGGCVLKLQFFYQAVLILVAATFGWLCVETTSRPMYASMISTATFGWLCVETPSDTGHSFKKFAATFGWLCVETTLTI